MNELNNNCIQPKQTTLPVELEFPFQPLIDNPAIWMGDGTSPAEILLAVAVLISTLTRLLQVLIPLFQTQSYNKEQ